MNIAVILAAGKSQRTGKANKVFYRIRKKPLIFYTLFAFERHPEIKKIILVARKEYFKKLKSLIKKYGFRKIAAISEGRKERQDSSFEGLKAAKALGAKKGDLILFHNGANPLISQQEITGVIKAAKKHKAALLAQPLKDTLKMARNNFVEKTISRQNLWLAQVPQAIEYSLAQKSFDKAKKDNFWGTDDVSLVERMGKRVAIVKSSYKNIKATTIDDLEIIERLL